MDLKLKGQYVLVTGSSRGIGKGIAAGFLQEGAQIVLTGRDQRTFNQTRAQFVRKYPRQKILLFPGDLQDPAVIGTLADWLSQQIGYLDHLVCNIGDGKTTSSSGEDMAELDRMFAVNFFGAARLAQAMRPLLARGFLRKKNYSTLTLIGSICGRQALGCPPAYAAAKAALAHYGRNLAREFAKDGIRVNVVSPGNILFPGSTWENKLAKNPQSVKDMLIREVPLNQFGSPADIGNVCAFLASPAAKFVTGADWVVDGGQTR
ncbi:MAG: SDR family oxidoreductase [Candidatus Omnitrophica bacterium]|nr:SDR family oxidoreductase [Candidatus Omnitrophota bacterium]